MKLTYTIDDDGVHLDCEICGKDFNLGFDATPNDAVRVEAEHFKECHLTQVKHQIYSINVSKSEEII